MESERTYRIRKAGLIIAGVLVVAAIVVYFVLSSRESWLTKSTIQRRVLPADQCVKTDIWFQDDTGRFIGDGEGEYIINGMEYFYEKTGVQPFLWGASFYDKVNSANSLSEREEIREQLLTEKYEELFGEDGGHVLIVLSDAKKSKNFFWYCYPGENAKLQVMDDEAVQILLDCLSY